MKVYAIAQVTAVTPHPEIGEYMRRIDATLAAHGARFLIHNSPFEVFEGDWPAGGVIVIEFPSEEAVKAWYASEEYQAIIPFRTRHTEMNIILAHGVTQPYSAAGTAAKLGL